MNSVLRQCRASPLHRLAGALDLPAFLRPLSSCRTGLTSSTPNSDAVVHHRIFDRSRYLEENAAFERNPGSSPLIGFHALLPETAQGLLNLEQQHALQPIWLPEFSETVEILGKYSILQYKL